MSPSTLMPGTTHRDVAVCGVRFSLHRADPPRRRRTTPVLLLHGVPETAAMWRDLVPELARDRTVLAPDLKGLGGSEIRGPYDVPTLVSELAALVLHEVDQRVDVVGHDWGGTLAAALAAQRPELVRRLVVCNAPYRHVDLRRAWHVPLFALPLVPEVGFTLGGERAVRAMLSAGWRSEPPLDPDVADHYAAAYRHPDRVDAMLGYYRAAVRARVARGVRRRMGNVPEDSAGPPPRPAPERTLVVWGERDPVLPRSVGEAVTEEVDGPTRLLPVPAAGHFVVEEASAVVVPEVAAFLREGDSADGTSGDEEETSATESSTAKKSASAKKSAAKKSAARKSATTKTTSSGESTKKTASSSGASTKKTASSSGASTKKSTATKKTTSSGASTKKTTAKKTTTSATPDPTAESRRDEASAPPAAHEPGTAEEQRPRPDDT